MTLLICVPRDHQRNVANTSSVLIMLLDLCFRTKVLGVVLSNLKTNYHFPWEQFSKCFSKESHIFICAFHFICDIEDKLGFDLTTEEAEKITNVQEAVNIFLKNYLKRSQTPPKDKQPPTTSQTKK